MARPGFHNHAKFRRLVHLLSVDEAQALGHVEFLWTVAYENGEPIIGDAIDVELAARWRGDPGKLAAALLACGGAGRAGLIEPAPDAPEGQLQIRDLWDHAPEYVTKRAIRETERRAKGKTLSDVRRDAVNARWARQRDAAASIDSIQTDTSVRRLYTNGVTPAPAPAPAPDTKTHTHPPAARADTASPKGDTLSGESPQGDRQHRQSPAPKRAAASSPKRDDPPGFARFWSIFPDRRKAGRAECRRIWERRDLEAIADDVVAGVERWKASDDWARESGRYIPGPAPFLNGAKWEANPPPRTGGKVMTNGHGHALTTRYPSKHPVRELPRC